MGLFSSINIAATGMSVERLRTDVISNNIANASTTRTQEGGPFKRREVILSSMGGEVVARHPFAPDRLNVGPGSGVRVKEITVDNTPGIMRYEPSHPDAYQSGPWQGYVEMPNVNIVNEMTDLIAASRAYEANASVIQGAKEMFSSALGIART
ncbi:MAG: flagellar basal body rod protein FlgC [Spirochaetaceae bacterium]|jgi:flagellar basal-body rod protein FlgC|nr:flagellar basal body rod protein FlgC [Spirochaetaceae bacterium]